MKLKQLLKPKQGEMYLRACIFIIVICIVFFLVWSFYLTVVMAVGQRKGAIQVLDHYTQYNAIDIYNSLKVMTDETGALDHSVYVADLCLAQNLTAEGSEYAAYSSGGNCRYKITDVQMTFVTDYTSQIQVSYTLNIPFRFMGTTTWLEIPITIASRLDPKFDTAGAPLGVVFA